MATWSGSYNQNPKILKGNQNISTGSYNVVNPNFQRALRTHSDIYKININGNEVSEIGKLLTSPLLTSFRVEDMKMSLFKIDYMEKTMGEAYKREDDAVEETKQQPLLDLQFSQEYQEKLEDAKFQKMFEERAKLPSFKMKAKILQMVNSLQVTLISGDTGCGKTTQIPQYILDDAITSGNGSMCKIICTQPRRISAISVAERICQERVEEVGISCGYQVRIEKILPRKHGSILFATNGMVLRYMESNPKLNGVSHLILDEIHERDNHTDFLLAVVKKLITVRKDIKVVLMSATLNEESFRRYFNYCPHLQIDRLSYDVEVSFLEDVVEELRFRFPSNSRELETLERNKKKFESDVLPYAMRLRNSGYSSETSRQLMNPMSEELNLDLIYELAVHILSTEPAGAILIFVTGFDDIKKLKMKFDSCGVAGRFDVITLHSQLPMDMQKSIFENPSLNTRRIIISTNIAETSVTVEDVVYVIDSGWSKVKTYDARTKTENLESKFISKANAIQRKGRAGRTRPGKCYRLYSKARYEAFFDYPKPEILRSRLEDIILQTKLLGFNSAQQFFDLLMDQPDPFIVARSLNLLQQIGAFESGEKLSPLGYYLAKLPISPQLGKMLLFGLVFSCLDPILSIVVGLDYKNPFMLNFGQQTGVNSKLVQFSEACKSDHLILYKALRLFIETRADLQEDMCKKLDLNIETMTVLKALKTKFMEHLVDLEFVPDMNATNAELNKNSTNLELIKSIIFAGLYPNYVYACTSPRRSFLTRDVAEVGIHKKSVLFSERLESVSLMAFYIKLRGGKLDLMHDATLASPFPLFFFGDASSLINIPDSNLKILMTRLKERFHAYFTYKLAHPGPTEEQYKDYEKDLLGIMVRLLSCPVNCSKYDLMGLNNIEFDMNEIARLVEMMQPLNF